jgi:hypothetical protein
MMINPIGEAAGALQSDDQLILLNRIFPSDSPSLPTSRPVAAHPAEKPSK